MELYNVLSKLKEMQGSEDVYRAIESVEKMSVNEACSDKCCGHDPCHCPADCKHCDCNKDKTNEEIEESRKQVNEATYRLEIEDLSSQDADLLSQLLTLAGQADNTGGDLGMGDAPLADPMGMGDAPLADPMGMDDPVGMDGSVGMDPEVPDMGPDGGIGPGADMDPAMDPMGGIEAPADDMSMEFPLESTELDEVDAIDEELDEELDEEEVDEDEELSLESIRELAGIASPVIEQDVEEVEEDEVEEAFANAPDEEYADAETQLNRLSGGLNRKKKQWRRGNNDNSMAIESVRESLEAEWNTFNKSK